MQKPGLPHCSRRSFFYTPEAARAQEGVYEVDAFRAATTARRVTQGPSATGDLSLRCRSSCARDDRVEVGQDHPELGMTGLR
jgi:hypothetical protein